MEIKIRKILSFCIIILFGVGKSSFAFTLDEPSLYRGIFLDTRSKQISEAYSAELEKELNSYVTEICNYIKNCWNPPFYSANITTIVRFVVVKDGTILNPRVYRSSGNKKMDKAAVQAVKDAVKYKPLPDLYKQDFMELQMAFEYHTLVKAKQ